MFQAEVAAEAVAATDIQRAVRGAMARSMVSGMEDEIDAIMRSMAVEADAEELAVGSDDGSDDGVWAQRAVRSPTPPLRKHGGGVASMDSAVLRPRSSGESAVRWEERAETVERGVAVSGAGSRPSAQGSGGSGDGSSGGDLFAYFPQMLPPDEQEAQPEERDTAFDGADGPLNRASEFGRLQDALDGGGLGKLGAIVFAPMVAGDGNVVSNGGGGSGSDGISDSDDDFAANAAMTSAAAVEEEECGDGSGGGDLFAHFPQLLAPEEQEAQPAERDTAFDGPDGPTNRASEFGRLQDALDGGGAGKLGAIVFSSWASSAAVAGVDAESSDAAEHGASAAEARGAASDPGADPEAAAEQRAHSDWYASTLRGVEQATGGAAGGEQLESLALQFGFVASGAAASGVSGGGAPSRSASQSGPTTASETEDSEDHYSSARRRRSLSRSRSATPERARFVCANCGVAHNEADGVQLMRCSRCEVACYCSRDCQVAHWPLHKHACGAPPPRSHSPASRPRDGEEASPGVGPGADPGAGTLSAAAEGVVEGDIHLDALKSDGLPTSSEVLQPGLHVQVAACADAATGGGGAPPHARESGGTEEDEALFGDERVVNRDGGGTSDESSSDVSSSATDSASHAASDDDARLHGAARDGSIPRAAPATAEREADGVATPPRASPGASPRVSPDDVTPLALDEDRFERFELSEESSSDNGEGSAYAGRSADDATSTSAAALAADILGAAERAPQALAALSLPSPTARSDATICHVTTHSPHVSIDIFSANMSPLAAASESESDGEREGEQKRGVDRSPLARQGGRGVVALEKPEAATGQGCYAPLGGANAGDGMSFSSSFEELSERVLQLEIDDTAEAVARLRREVRAARVEVAQLRGGGDVDLQQLQRANRARARNARKRTTKAQAAAATAGAALEALLLTQDYERGLAAKAVAKAKARLAKLGEVRASRAANVARLESKLAESLGVELGELDALASPAPGGVARQTPAQLAALAKLRAQLADRQLAVDAGAARVAELRIADHEQLLSIKTLEKRSKHWKGHFASIKLELGGVRKRLGEKRRARERRSGPGGRTPGPGSLAVSTATPMATMQGRGARRARGRKAHGDDASPLFSPLRSKPKLQARRGGHAGSQVRAAAKARAAAAAASPRRELPRHAVRLSPETVSEGEHDVAGAYPPSGDALVFVLGGPESEADEEEVLRAALLAAKARQGELRDQLAAFDLPGVDTAAAAEAAAVKERSALRKAEDAAAALQARAAHAREQDRLREQKEQLTALMASLEAAQSVLIEQRKMQLREEKARVARGVEMCRDIDLMRSGVSQRKTQTSMSLRRFQMALAEQRRERQVARDLELIAEHEAEKQRKAVHAERERRILLACLRQNISRKEWERRDATRRARRDLAATAIQTQARGYGPRCWLKAVRRERAAEAARVAARRGDAATALQCVARSRAARVALRGARAAAAERRRLDDAATSLQCAARARGARGDLERRRVAAAELARAHVSATTLQCARRTALSARRRNFLIREAQIYAAATAIACVARARAAAKVAAALRFKRDVKRRRAQRKRNEAAKREKEAREKEKAKRDRKKAKKSGAAGKKEQKKKKKGPQKKGKAGPPAAVAAEEGAAAAGPGVSAHWSVVPEGQAAQKHSAEVLELRAMLRAANAEAAKAKAEMSAQRALAKQAREAEKERKEEMLEARELVARMRKQERQQTKAMRRARAEAEDARSDAALATVMQAATADARAAKMRVGFDASAKKAKALSAPAKPLKKKTRASPVLKRPRTKAEREAAARAARVSTAAAEAEELKQKLAARRTAEAELSAAEKLARRVEQDQLSPWGGRVAVDEQETTLGFMGALVAPIGGGVNLDAALGAGGGGAPVQPRSVQRRNFQKEAAVANAQALAAEREAARPKRWGRHS